MTAAAKTSNDRVNKGPASQGSKRESPLANAPVRTGPTSATKPAASAQAAPGRQAAAGVSAPSPWAAPGVPRPRAGSRHSRVVVLLDRAGWLPSQVQRDFQLRPPTAPPSVARRHHHGSRDDRISYVLSARPGTPTAVVATVGAQHDPETGLGRAIRQATKLDVPLAYATNGTDIVEHFLASGQTRPVVNLAAPVRAWRAYLRLHRLRRVGAQLVPQGFDLSILTGSLPAGLRYYQLAGINRVLGAISRGERRAAITLAPDTGTTVSAAALMAKYANYRLHSDPSRHCGLLYIDDRLPSAGATDPVAAIRRLAESTAADVHIASLGDSFAALSPAQVDLVVINLSHGGQTADPSTWRDVVERFGDAVQVAIVGVPPAGARAVHEYFGNAVYRYTADQGRADGYLPPVGPSVPDPANSAPVGAGLDRAVAAAGSGGSAGSAAGQQDPVAVAVEIRRSIEYTKLAAGQAALASELVSLLKLAKRPGAVGRAAKRRAGQLTELEILAELEDQVGGEAAVLRHIAVLKELLRA